MTPNPLPQTLKVCFAFALLSGGCARPHLMPALPQSSTPLPNEICLRAYDGNHDGRADYAEALSDDGRVRALRLDTNFDGDWDEEVVLDELRRSNARELIIILDSVPFHLVQQLCKQGRFRLFHEPSHIVSPFPVMTDLSLAEFFGVSPCPGIESRYFNGERSTDGYLTYFLGGNAPWLPEVEYFLKPIHHGHVYLRPYAGYLHELHGMETTFYESEKDVVHGYSVGASALGSIEGTCGHQKVLLTVDRFCQAVMQRARGAVHITLMSDHGHNLVESAPVSLHKELRKLGYHDNNTIRGEIDVVVPRFGPVTCAGIYTQRPDQVARNAASLVFVELAFYQDGMDIAVISQSGEARISKSPAGYRYTAQKGDPLELFSVLERLKEEGKMDADGFVTDRDLFEATFDHTYPDPLHRLWRAFHGLMIHTPDVMVSLKDGYVYGTSFFNAFVKMKSAHGSLRRSSTHGFVMSTAGKLPDFVRMEDLASELRLIGLNP